jgi:pyruvate,orthophosphate dikinase
VTIDGDSGNLYLGRLETATTRPDRELAEVARWQRSGLQAIVPL